MKRLKNLLSLLLVVLVVLSMGVTAFAANGTGTITITNTTVDANYNAYKIFDATVNGDKIAYSIKDSDAWYSLVSAADSPFQLTATSTANTYNVSVKENMDDAAVINWLNNQNPAGDPAATGVGNGGVLQLGTVDYGYYFITSTLGGTVTVSSVNPDAVVIDKNQKPGWDPDPENPDDPDTGKFVSATGGAGSYDKSSTAGINDTAYFKIAAHVPAYAGKTQVKDYTFTDTLGDGFTYNNDMAVTIEGVTLTAGTDYEVTQSGQTITAVIHASAIKNYPTDAHVVMTYSTTVDKDAEYMNVNTVNMDWSYLTTPEGDEPEPPQDTETTTYVYGFNLVKVDKGTGQKIDGAEFTLLDADKKEIAVVSENGKYRVATAGETGEVIKAGDVKIFGLDEGTYYLLETKQPDGYNMLTEPYQFVLSASDNYDSDGISVTPVKVENSAGTTLPETGGIGTTIFYIVGGTLMIGAIVLLVTKKKMSASKEN
jgi:fimbrial isopeptide formation D2 family protein/LPXTG-motif cell wall-anchored protein